MTAKYSLDLLTVTAGDLRKLLDARIISSTDLVKIYLQQIRKHNHDGLGLRAIISLRSEFALIEEAQALDEERWTSGPRSALHGIPITMKDIICTADPELGTTSGSFALQGRIPSTDAVITTQLKNAGAIVIGKTNMSEWGNSKDVELTSGWSAVGGQVCKGFTGRHQISLRAAANNQQTQSPYVEGGVDPDDKWLGHSTPAGSSSGSAVAVASGFTPLCIGTEADGSIVQPAIRAALYSIKGTIGDVSMVGTQSGGQFNDSAGPLAKSVEDCASVMEILLPGRDFHSHLGKSWAGIGIASLDYDTWQWPEAVCNRVPAFDDQHVSEYRFRARASATTSRELEIMLMFAKRLESKEALEKVADLGAQVVDAELLKLSEIAEKYNTVQLGDIGGYELAPGIKRFLAIFRDPEMQTLQDVVDFGRAHAPEELPEEHPGQVVLERGLQNHMSEDEYKRATVHLRQTVRDLVEKCLTDANAEFIMASGESVLTTIAAAAGYPIASVPLGFSNFNGRPFGMEIMARNGQEERLFEIMSAWEVTFPAARQPPPQLLDCIDR